MAFKEKTNEKHSFLPPKNCMVLSVDNFKYIHKILYEGRFYVRHIEVLSPFFKLNYNFTSKQNGCQKWR